METEYERLKNIITEITEDSITTNAKSKKYKDIKEDSLVMLISDTEEYKAGSIFIKRSSKLERTFTINNKDLKISKFAGVIVKLVKSNELLECIPAESKSGLFVELTKVKYKGEYVVTKGGIIKFVDTFNRYLLTVSKAVVTISTDRINVNYLVEIKDTDVHLTKRIDKVEIFTTKCLPRSLADINLMIKLFNHSHYYHLANNKESSRLINTEIIHSLPMLDKKSITGFSEYIYKCTPVDYLVNTKLTVEYNMLHIASIIGVEQLEVLYRNYLTNEINVEDLARLL